MAGAHPLKFAPSPAPVAKFMQLAQFLGEAFLGLTKLFRGRTRLRFSDLVSFMAERKARPFSS